MPWCAVERTLSRDDRCTRHHDDAGPVDATRVLTGVGGDLQSSNIGPDGDLNQR